jgi:hypothetical protein
MNFFKRKKKEPPQQKVDKYTLEIRYKDGSKREIWGYKGNYRFLYYIYRWFSEKNTHRYSVRLTNNQFYLIIRSEVSSVEIKHGKIWR